MVPIGILLGPMVMPFVWFRERIDPAVWNAPAGSAVQIVATVDSDWSEPVRIDVPPPVVVDDSTPASRTLPPLRETLEHLLALYRQPRDDPGEPWELKLAPDLGREQTANDLQAYLDAGIPPQGITWLIRPPDDPERPILSDGHGRRASARDGGRRARRGVSAGTVPHCRTGGLTREGGAGGLSEAQA